MATRKPTHVDDPREVGRRVRDARAKAGLSQRQLAFPGCSAAYLSRIESGERTPSLPLLRRLAERLEVSPEFLAEGRGGDDIEMDEDLVQADVALRLDEREVAEHLYSEILRAPRTAERRAQAHEGLGQLAFRRAEPADAVEHFEAALELYGDGAPSHPALADSLGRAYSMLGEFETAAGLFKAGLHKAKEDEDPLERLRFSVLLSNVLIDSERLSDAEAALADVLGAMSETTDPLARARVFWSQSRLHDAQGQASRAARYARKALDILEATEHTQYVARAHQLLAHIELNRGRAPEALDLLRRGTELLSRSGNRFEVARFQLEEARALVVLGGREEALTLAAKAAAVLQEVNPADAGRAYVVLAEAFEARGEHEHARQLLQHAVELLAGSPNRYLVDAYEKLATVLEELGRRDEAFAALKAGMAARHEASQPVSAEPR